MLFSKLFKGNRIGRRCFGTTLPLTIVAESNRHNEHNDCVVKGIAIATNTSYRKTHKLCRKHGRKNRQGTSGKIIVKVLAELGFKAVPVKGTGKTFKTYKPPTNESYLVFSKSHCVAVVDGEIRDWSHGTTRRIFAQFKMERI